MTVHAVGVDGTTVAPAPGNSQPGQNFRFISSSCQYNTKSSGMAVGKHSLAYTAGLDPMSRRSTPGTEHMVEVPVSSLAQTLKVEVSARCWPWTAAAQS